jgi:hypothetical protein
MVVRRIQLWHAQGVDADGKIPALATYLGHVQVSDVHWYLSAVPELMSIVADRFDAFAQQPRAGAQQDHQPSRFRRSCRTSSYGA